jgi:hypothetical protein
MSTAHFVMTTRLRALFVSMGLPELVGGIEALDAGLKDLKAGLLVVAADLVMAEWQEVDLADAVLDPVRFPHAARMHGLLDDLLSMNVPAELERWVRKIARAGPLPDVPEINRAIATLAVAAANPFHRALARFGLFELLCLRQRLLLRQGRVQLEVMGGRRRDVEDLAEAEVDAACALAASGPDLLAIDDPLATIEKMATLALARYVELLRRELADLSAAMQAQLGRRERILAAMARVDAADAVLILNQVADEFGEERLGAMQLRQVHPLLLGELSRDAIYKRVERLPEKVACGKGSTGRSFGDMMLEIMKEDEK